MITREQFLKTHQIQKTLPIVRVSEMNGKRVPDRDFLDFDQNGVADLRTGSVRSGEQNMSWEREIFEFNEHSVEPGVVDRLRRRAEANQAEVVIVDEADDVWIRRANTLDGRDWSQRNTSTLQELADDSRPYKSDWEMGVAFDAVNQGFLLYRKSGE